MAIVFHEKTNTFHLTNKDVSYLIRIMENGQLENLYYGKALKDREDYSYMHEEEPRSQMSISMPEPSTLSMHYTRQEYPFCRKTGAGSRTMSTLPTIYLQARRA